MKCSTAAALAGARCSVVASIRQHKVTISGANWRSTKNHRPLVGVFPVQHAGICFLSYFANKFT